LHARFLLLDILVELAFDFIEKVFEHFYQI